jgi:stage V sporulation protein K
MTHRIREALKDGGFLGLGEIFRRSAERARYRISETAHGALKGEMERRWQQRGADFANGRDVRNLFERVISMQANRISALPTISEDALISITEEDVRLAAA